MQQAVVRLLHSGRSITCYVSPALQRVEGVVLECASLLETFGAEGCKCVLLTFTRCPEVWWVQESLARNLLAHSRA